jgi:DNA-binding transcriptional LysR family regulator
MVLARRGIAVPRLLEFGTLEAIFGCVFAGLGITLLPRALIGPVWRDGRVSIHRLPPAEAMVTTVFIHRREAHLSSALRAFIDHVRGKASNIRSSDNSDLFQSFDASGDLVQQVSILGR